MKTQLSKPARDGGNGDVFEYDLNDQVNTAQFNIPSPDNAPPVPQNIFYDAGGNRTTFSVYGQTDTYTTGNLDQYTIRNGTPATYNTNGDMTVGFDGSSYVFDSENHLTHAVKSPATVDFYYDGLGRQVKRTVTGILGGTTFNVWDGWTLLQEYVYINGNATTAAGYVTGATGLVKNLVTDRYYYQDALGSTSHLADNNGHLLEWYRYDLQGKPTFYGSNDKQLTVSGYGSLHLFTGQRWYSELGLYDLRNRFYSPDIGRFIQPDPIGFGGGNNLYRYCGNNPVNSADPLGLEQTSTVHGIGNDLPEVTIEEQVVEGNATGTFSPSVRVENYQNHAGSTVYTDRRHEGGRGVPDYTPASGGAAAAPAPATSSPSTTGVPVANNGVIVPVMTIEVTTVIESGWWAGLKSYHWATADVFGHTRSGTYVGATYNYLHGTYDRGIGQFDASPQRQSGTVLPVVDVKMTGHARSADLPEWLAIDYQFNVRFNLISGTATVTGRHDGYPSYTVTVNGQTLYYYHEHFLDDLREPMEIVVGEGR